MRRATSGLVFVVGLVLGLIGYVGDVYSNSIATLLMLGVWFIGGALVAVIVLRAERGQPVTPREPAAGQDGADRGSGGATPAPAHDAARVDSGKRCRCCGSAEDLFYSGDDICFECDVAYYS